MSRGAVAMPDDAKYTPPPRPQLVIRVGITGSRKLDTSRTGWIEARLAEILTHIHRTVTDLATRPDVVECHDRGTAPVTPRFRFLSPLAEGADRLAARTAEAAGFELIVPMPF